MKPLLCVVFAILLVYTWNYMLTQIGAKTLLWAVYIMAGFLVPAAYNGIEKPKIKTNLSMVLFFSLGISIVDIAITSLLFTKLALITLADAAVKLAISFAGATIYILAQKTFASEKKILFTTSGILIRRLTAGLLDMNILVIIFAALTAASFLIQLSQVVIATGTVLIVFAYKAAHESQFSQTPGKKIVGLSVKCTIPKAAIRNIPFALLFAAPALGHQGAQIIYSIVFADLLLFFTGKRLFDWLAGTSIKADKKA